MQSIEHFEPQFLSFIQKEMVQDLAHDINHVLRVVSMAKRLCVEEKGKEAVVIPAAYLHDCFSFAKDHPNRSQSSAFAADKALAFLKEIGYPPEFYDEIHHAIVAHSFSAKVETRTLEAKIVQDADRLDALGAIGIARCLQVSTKLNSPLYFIDDPFCYHREPNDKAYTIDHFYAKLLTLANTMKTISAVAEAEKRTQYMRDYLTQLESEL
ncbi:HD domain-containing protein [Aliivibrio fischeri]|uniref:HD domain-containing protein n=1 Tax=Aliivibrio fischeri TaxID=668 RepID=UPI0012D99BE9|nr:HD domain-containing protein [Aliivibrio fischeri]MUK62973.1 HD domain-containing protein [Aliivibrio fischeri]MUL20410.1 HD domain-containing protein [Aliivibrio fischeri]MUL24185.1 HD domain-containing protein [Aliivibrio fischeri]